jgi:hypothetical protein
MGYFAFSVKAGERKKKEAEMAFRRGGEVRIHPLLPSSSVQERDWH